MHRPCIDNVLCGATQHYSITIAMRSTNHSQTHPALQPQAAVIAMEGKALCQSLIFKS